MDQRQSHSLSPVRGAQGDLISTPPPSGDLDVSMKPLLENLESKVVSQLTDVQLMLSHSDLQTQKQFKKTRELATQLEQLKQSLNEGAIAPTVRRLVTEFLREEREKEPEARVGAQTARNAGLNGGLMKEIAVFSDELKIIQNQVKELQWQARDHLDQYTETKQKVQVLMASIEEKATKNYVDFKVDACIQKEALFEMKQQMSEMTSKTDIVKYQFGIGTQVEGLKRRIQEIREEYIPRTEMLEEFNKFIVKQRASFIPRDEYNQIQAKADERSKFYDELSSSHDLLLHQLDVHVKDLSSQVKSKADRQEMKQVSEDLMGYCRYDDLKDLYSKVVPAISAFDKTIQSYNSDIDRFKSMIQRMDEIMTEKANKVAVDEISNQLKGFVSEQILTQFLKTEQQKRDIQKKEFDQFRSESKYYQENITREIANIVRKQTNTIRNQLLYHLSPNQGGGEQQMISLDAKDVKKLINSKVDKSDLDAVIEAKASKNDCSRALKNIEVIHSQLSHFVVLLMEFIKLIGMGPAEEEKYESEKEWQSRRKFMNKQAQKVSRWVFTFNPTESGVSNTSGGSLEELLLQQAQEIRDRAKTNKVDILQHLLQSNSEPETPLVSTLTGDYLNSAALPTSLPSRRKIRRDQNMSIVTNQYDTSPVPSNQPRTQTAGFKGGLPGHMRARLMLDKTKLHSSQQKRGHIFAQVMSPQPSHTLRESTEYDQSKDRSESVEATANLVTPRTHNFIFTRSSQRNINHHQQLKGSVELNQNLLLHHSNYSTQSVLHVNSGFHSNAKKNPSFNESPIYIASGDLLHQHNLILTSRDRGFPSGDSVTHSLEGAVVGPPLINRSLEIMNDSQSVVHK